MRNGPEEWQQKVVEEEEVEGWRKVGEEDLCESGVTTGELGIQNGDLDSQLQG